MKKPILLLILLLSLTTSFAQDKLLKGLTIEAGADFMSCDPPDEKSYIRADVVTHNYYGSPASYVRALFYKNYYGLKFEKRVLDNKIGISSGLRYTRNDASIGKDTYWSTHTNYFYLLFRKEGTTTEFLRVRSISQLSHYLGAPLEIRIYPYKERKVQIYYKIAMDFNVFLSGDTRLVFYEKNMEPNSKEASKLVEDPWKFYATVTAAIGLKIGDSSKPGLNLEACAPSGLIYNRNSSFINPLYGGGIQINFRFPL